MNTKFDAFKKSAFLPLEKYSKIKYKYDKMGANYCDDTENILG